MAGGIGPISFSVIFPSMRMSRGDPTPHRPPSTESDPHTMLMIPITFGHFGGSGGRAISSTGGTGVMRDMGASWDGGGGGV